MTQSKLQDKFIQANYYSSGDNGDILRLVVHDEEYPVSLHSAEDIGNFFSHATTGSAHYVVDGDSVVGCVAETQIAYHDGHNINSIGTEHDGYAHFTKADWNLPGSQATLHKSAQLHADLATRHDIPIRLLTAEQVRENMKGLHGHDVSSEAFHSSDHSDPGPQFPWQQFFTLIKANQTGTIVHPPVVPVGAPKTSKDVKPPVPTTPPIFPLPVGYFFGPQDGPPQSVSGYFSHHGPTDLVLWQTRMHARGFDIACDGYYGPKTAEITKQFQTNKHLKVDGRIGQQTWAAAWTTPVG